MDIFNRILKEDAGAVFKISQLEQDIACNSDKPQHRRSLEEYIANPDKKTTDKLRLAMLYMIRYERESREVAFVKRKLSEAGLAPSNVDLIDTMLNYAGEVNLVTHLVINSIHVYTTYNYALSCAS